MSRYCRKLGSHGEDFAARMLEDSGYMIIERNFRTRYGEIDIIASRDGVLHFIEVKTRTGSSCGFPADAVTRDKQNVIRKVSAAYLAGRRTGWSNISLDVMEVTVSLIENCM